jgi:hypothetical protein
MLSLECRLRLSGQRVRRVLGSKNLKAAQARSGSPGGVPLRRTFLLSVTGRMLEKIEPFHFGSSRDIQKIGN